jgi:hypothetical protein
MKRVEYIKRCHCIGTSTTGRVTMTHRMDEKTLAIIGTVTLHPGPVCDVCDMPWEGPHLTEEDDKTMRRTVTHNARWL